MGFQCYTFELPQMQLDLSFSVLELQRHDELFLHLCQELHYDNTVILLYMDFCTEVDFFLLKYKHLLHIQILLHNDLLLVRNQD